MIIQIDGTNTKNKGAELMLYTIIEQVGDAFPDSTIVLNLYGTGFRYKKNYIKIKQPLRLKYFRYPRAVLSRLRMPYVYFTDYYPIKNVDLLLDASGFKFGDQWSYPSYYLDRLEVYYRKMKAMGTKIILLPQAFGPFTSNSSKKSLSILDRYVDKFFARESLSHNYLIEAGIKANKIHIYPDFTITSKGIIPHRFAYLKNHVCLIPNSKMLSHSNTSFDLYFQLFNHIIKKSIEYKKKVFLLNHEGEDDYKLCQMINEKLDNRIPIATKLNALEIKGLIGNSHMVVSSRFHGVSSALNQGIPCLATSWSHKYQYLFEEFGLTNNIIDITNSIDTDDIRIPQLLAEESNRIAREYLLAKGQLLNEKIESMWKIVWSYDK